MLYRHPLRVKVLSRCSDSCWYSPLAVTANPF